MWKSIFFIIIFAFAVLISVSAMVNDSFGHKSADPVQKLKRIVSKSVSNVENATPDLLGAIKGTDISLPSINGKKNTYTGENHINVDFSGDSFTGKLLSKSNFNGALLTGTSFQNTILEKSGFEGAQGISVNFAYANMDGAQLTAAFFQDSDFTKASLREAIGRGTFLQGSKFIDADISFARFSGADFSSVDFSKAYAISANLSHAILKGANFSNADLSGVRFSNADLTGVKMDGANVRLADFSDTILNDVDLTKVTNLQAEQINQACGNENTILPNGQNIRFCEGASQ